MPTPAALIPLIGKNLVVQITPQVLDAVGNMTDDTVLGTQSFSGRLDPFDGAIDLKTEDVSALNIFSDNPVPYQMGGTYTINEIAMPGALPVSGASGFGTGSILQKASQISFYHKLVLSIYDNAATPALKASETLYMLMTQPRRWGVQKGKVIYTAQFQIFAVIDSATGAELANPSVLVPGF